MNVFKVRDFKSPNADGSFCIEEFIYQAHKVLLSKAKRVYGRFINPEIDGVGSWCFSDDKGEDDTHTALLIDVKEIEKECVVHEPMRACDMHGNIDENTFRNRCSICGKKLKAKFEVVE